MMRIWVLAILAFFAACPIVRGAKPASADAVTEPAVLRVNGGFVRLMCVQVAIGEAHVKADKAQVSELLKDAGSDQNELRVMMLEGHITPAQYAKGADAALISARARLAKLLGDEAAAKVEAAYDLPYTSAEVYLNQIRTAVAELGTGDAFKAADQAVYKRLAELAALASHPEQRTPPAIAKIRKQAQADVVAALGESQRDAFEKVLKGLTSYHGATTTPTTTTAPAKSAK